jgi:peptidoglycan hydrolase CwlO-like protein
MSMKGLITSDTSAYAPNEETKERMEKLRVELREQPADGLQAQIDALRAAIVSRNGLLEAISEQIRLGFETSVSPGYVASKAEMAAIVAGLNNVYAEIKPLAERLSALESRIAKNEEYRVQTVGYQNRWCHDMKAAIKELSSQLKQNKALTGKQRRRKKR